MLYQQSTVDAAELPRQWTAPQFEELQLLALSCLNAFLPRMLDVFHANRGVSVLLSALCWALEEPSAAFDATIASDTRLFRGAGNAFHATGVFFNLLVMKRLFKNESILLCIFKSFVSFATELPSLLPCAPQFYSAS